MSGTVHTSDTHLQWFLDRETKNESTHISRQDVTAYECMLLIRLKLQYVFTAKREFKSGMIFFHESQQWQVRTHANPEEKRLQFLKGILVGRTC